jgi:hypothetical protein
LSVQGYGLWSGPTDHRLRQVTINYPRHLWIRDMMIANGDAHKPIWMSEAGWNPVPDDPAIAEVDRYGRVTMEQAAEWAPLAYERARTEWPWIGVIAYWYFKPADESNKGDSSYYFRMVEPDFTPTPIYESLKAYMTGDKPPLLREGRYGVGHHGVSSVNAEGRETRTFRFEGTEIHLCYADVPAAQPVVYDLDSTHLETLIIPAGGAGCVQVCDTVEPGEHTLTLAAADWTGLESLVVIDETFRNHLPWTLTGIVAGLFVGVVWGYAVAKQIKR